MRVLAVCLGNICRSPAAEAAIAEAAAEAGIALDVDSAGTGNWHAGEDPDPRMVAAGARVGLAIGGRARQVTTADFRDFDLIVAMDRTNLADLERLRPPDAKAELRLFRDFDPSVGGVDQDVPDPYYGGPDGFDDVVVMVRSAAAGLVASIR